MDAQLRNANLWCNNDDTDEIDISVAWGALSRLGRPVRYGGKSQDGSHEFIVIDPATGDFLAIGKGTTLEMSMCDAALKAVSPANQARPRP